MDPKKISYAKSLYDSMKPINGTVCSDPFYLVDYYVKWVTTSWTYCSSEYFAQIPYKDRIAVSCSIYYQS